MAFPTTTTVLDTFTRADEDPLSGGSNWPGVIFPSDSSLRVVTNACWAPAGGLWGSRYWLTSFGADQEVWATVSVHGTNTELVARIQNPGASGVNNYFVDIGPTTNAWKLYKTVANSQTDITGTVPPTQALTAGDKIGLGVIGTTVSAYHQPGGTGAWNLIIQNTDSSVTGAGFIGAVLNSDAIDDFGGGTVVGGGGSTNAPEVLRVVRSVERM